MRRMLFIFILLFPISILFAAESNLVLVPAPDNYKTLTEVGFLLFHRAGDYWIGILPAEAPLPPGGRVLTDYDPQKGDIYRLIMESPAEANQLSGRVNILYSEGSEALIQAAREQLRALPALKAQWIRVSTRPKPMGYSGVEIPPSDDFHPIVQTFVDQINQTLYVNIVQTLENFTTRNTYTSNCDSAAHWIQAQFQSYGLTTQLDPFSISGYTKYNVVAELLGTVHPDSLVLVVAHYDATAGRPSEPEPVSPGADDNGSGTACVLECARILSQYQFERTIRFVTFAGEEQGLVGSEDYVSNLMQANARLVGCFNYDMIAWSGSDPPPPDLIIYTDFNPLSIAMADKVADAVYSFVPSGVEPVILYEPGMGSSDHGPFWDVGWPAICGIEERAWGPDFNPYYHSVNDLVVNCDMDYAVNCTRAAIAALAEYAGPITASGPALSIADWEISEVAGNGNGLPDPGETVNILVTLRNMGVSSAAGISAIIATTDPNLTVLQNSASFPNLAPQQTGTAYQPYSVAIDINCPQGALVTASLNITAGGGYQRVAPLYFTVSDPVNLPLGPDSYGYRAYDSFDPEGPAYDWIEVDPGAGGSGTLINFTGDDQTEQVNLPFAFRYYGQDYNNISVCSNGWIAMGTTASTDYSNSHIPDPDGPPAMIAPFWEDLSPQLLGSVSYYHHQIDHSFIVEFNGVRQYRPTSAVETFEAILYDPNYRPTITGDGEILFQYAGLSDPGSCTVGIEDNTQTVGLEYLYNGDYDSTAAQLRPGMAVLFTTLRSASPLVITLTPANPPVQIPGSGGTFDFTVSIRNDGASLQTFDGWIVARLPNGNIYGPIILRAGLNIPAGATLQRQLTQSVPAAAPMGSYSYIGRVGSFPDSVWSEDEFPFVKLAGDAPPAHNQGWTVHGWDENTDASSIQHSSFGIQYSYPNPFNASTALSFKMQAASNVKLAVYDVSGREVAVLAEGYYNAGTYRAVWNASTAPSGVYFAKLTAANTVQTRKLLLVK